VTNSTFADNSASCGGAICNAGTATVTSSTFSNNVAGDAGGAIFNANDVGETLAVINSTFDGNNAECGGAICNTFAAGNATLDNTLIVYGSSGEGCDGPVPGTSNLEFPGPVATCGPGTTVTTSNPQGNNTLSDNGGPTQTIALPAGSAAINAATNCPPPTTDQRDVSRPQGTACDIGAFELQQQPSPPPPMKNKKHKKKGKGSGGISQG
jgi:hypothetical protein